MPTHKRNLRYYTDEGNAADVTEAVTANGDVAFTNDESIAALAEIEIDVAFPQAKLKSVLLYSPKAGTFRSNANHLGSPGDTIVIPAGGGAVAWNSNDTASNPFHLADVTKIYFTNDHATLAIAAGGVKIRALVDVTP